MINVALPFILGSSYLILLCNLTFGACKLLSDTEYHRIHFFKSPASALLFPWKRNNLRFLW
jgi:hypothetical protein